MYTELDKEVILLLHKGAKSEKEIQDCFGLLKTDEEKRAMIRYLEENPEATHADRMYQAVQIAVPRLNAQNAKGQIGEDDRISG